MPACTPSALSASANHSKTMTSIARCDSRQWRHYTAAHIGRFRISRCCPSCLNVRSVSIAARGAYVGKMIYSQFSSQVHVGVLIRSASIRRRWSYRPHDACTTLGDRAFQVTAARAWNALPSSVRSAPSLLQFRRDLKTALHVSVVVLFAIVSSCVTDCNF